INLNPMVTLLGSMDERFGYSLLITRFNGDRFSDLFVAAPSRSGTTYGGVKYYPGPVSTTPTLTFKEHEIGSGYGTSIVAGDFNRDGFYDLAVGAPSYNGNTTDRGAVYIYLGSNSPDADVDFVLMGNTSDSVGLSLAAGDFDGDGYDDLVALGRGKLYTMFGNSTLDRNLSYVVNLTMYGIQPDTLRSLGDVDGDSYDDLAMIEMGTDVVIVFGDRRQILLTNPSTISIVPPRGSSSDFAWSVAPLGDYDHTAGGEIAVGDPGANSNRGAVYIYTLSQTGTTLLTTLKGQRPWQRIGTGLGEGVDLLKDGWVDVIAGGDMYVGGTSYGNGSYIIYEHRDLSDLGNNRPEIYLGGVSSPIYSNTGVLNTTVVVSGWEDELNSVISTIPPTSEDTYGNKFVVVLLQLKAYSEGEYRISDLKIEYSMPVKVNITSRLNSLLQDPSVPADPEGNLRATVKVVGDGPGGVNITITNMTLDLAPWMIEEIPDIEFPEDGWSDRVLDLRNYIADDRTPFSDLAIQVRQVVNASRGRIFVSEDGYIGIDMQNGSLNDNWAGYMTEFILCTDSRGLLMRSNVFTVFVFPVNDPPYITRTPPRYIDEDKEFSFDHYFDDIEGDPVTVTLVDGPENMTVDSNGTLHWTPTNWDVGEHNFTIKLSDGKDYSTYTFSIVVNNTEDPPVITSTPPTIAYVGETYYYNITAYDIDPGDRLIFTLYDSPTGMKMTSDGRISFNPDYEDVGVHRVSIGVSDGIVEVYQNYTLKVMVYNLPPEISPISDQRAGDLVPFHLKVNATDPNPGELLRYSLLQAPEGMEIDNITGEISWTPSPEQVGNHTVVVQVSDGKVNVTATFKVEVVRSERHYTLIITKPKDGQRVSGVFYVEGTARVSPGEVQWVEVRIDGGKWERANGTLPYRYRMDAKFLDSGVHRIEVRCTDGYVYSEIVGINVTVEHEKGTSPFVYVGVALIIVAAGAAGFFAFKRVEEKRKEEEERRKREEEERRAKEEMERFRERLRRGEILQEEEVGPTQAEENP
ncbi:MAG: FG-GAP repeat protein, partial [Thermoplasmata archaeon]|nr:FG-GAP repeat protein [Thermoplasmata archaeon]